MDGQMDRWMDGWLVGGWILHAYILYISHYRLEGWMDGWNDGWTDGWMDGWILHAYILYISHSLSKQAVDIESNKKKKDLAFFFQKCFVYLYSSAPLFRIHASKRILKQKKQNKCNLTWSASPGSPLRLSFNGVLNLQLLAMLSHLQTESEAFVRLISSISSFHSPDLAHMSQSLDPLRNLCLIAFILL